jgi:hypothetical protein
MIAASRCITALLSMLDLSPVALAAANICPATGLATDYLNHFNEVAMLIEMLPMMPEAAQDVLDWAPRAYPDHFTVTGFRDKDLAVAAWRAADVAVIARFEAACVEVEGLIGLVQESLRGGEALERIASEGAAIYAAISAAGAIILGENVPEGEDQAAIDALFD